jgi:hypothetical protein
VAVAGVNDGPDGSNAVGCVVLVDSALRPLGLAGGSRLRAVVGVARVVSVNVASVNVASVNVGGVNVASVNVASVNVGGVVRGGVVGFSG